MHRVNLAAPGISRREMLCRCANGFGGGGKAGTTFGANDDYGYFAIENKVHVHDLHATILHLLGLDHTKLTYPFSGRNMRLTDVHGRVVQEILV